MVLNLESEIEILLFDQNKIVSYKELGHKFNLTPFQARKELNKFIAKKKKSKDEKSKFFCTFLIIGEDNQTKKKRVLLTNETDLEQNIKEMTILSQQIYSIQTNDIFDFDLIYASDLDASNNMNRKCNLKVSTKLGSLPTSQMDVDKPSQMSEDDMLMQMDMPVIDSKSSKSKPKTEDQENKPVVKKPEIKKEPETKKSESAILKDMDQIKQEKKADNDGAAKKQKLEINAPTADKPKATAAAGKATAKKTNEPAKNQQTMMNFFKKKA